MRSSLNRTETCTPTLLPPCVRRYHNSSLSVYFPDLGTAARGSSGGSHCFSCPLTTIRVHSTGRVRGGGGVDPQRGNACDLRCRTKPPAATLRRGDRSQTNVHAPTFPITSTIHPPPTLPTPKLVSPQGPVASSCCRGLPSCGGDKGSQGNDGDPVTSLQSRRKRPLLSLPVAGVGAC